MLAHELRVKKIYLNTVDGRLALVHHDRINVLAKYDRYRYHILLLHRLAQVDDATMDTGKDASHGLDSVTETCAPFTLALVVAGTSELLVAFGQTLLVLLFKFAVRRR